jgi:hypothetical protein
MLNLITGRLGEVSENLKEKTGCFKFKDRPEHLVKK